MSVQYGVRPTQGIRDTYGIGSTYGIRSSYGVGTDGLVPVVANSTLVGSSGSFAASGGSITITFTARDANNNVVVGYQPVVETGVV